MQLEIHRRNPLYMEDIQESYGLTDGIVHLFLVPVACGRYGRRYYLKSLHPGAIFYGGRIRLEGREFVVAAVPQQAMARIEKETCPAAFAELEERRQTLAAYARDYLADERKTGEISRKKEVNEERVTDAGLRAFLKISGLGGKEVPAPSTSDNPLYEAVGLICRYAHIRLISAEELSGRKESATDLDSLAKAAQLNFREVLLEDNWWRQDNGPLLAYRKDDKRPVALIPLSPGSYLLHDAARSQTLRLSAQLAGQLEPRAVMLYRPFPPRSLNLLDILKIGAQNSWKRDFIVIGVMSLAGALIGLLVPKVSQIMIDTYIPGGERDQLYSVGFCRHPAGDRGAG